MMTFFPKISVGVLMLQAGWFVDCVGFYGISTFVGYLIPNSVFIYIKSKISK